MLALRGFLRGRGHGVTAREGIFCLNLLTDANFGPALNKRPMAEKGSGRYALREVANRREPRTERENGLRRRGDGVAC